MSERYATLDLLRGFALFGVLLINLLYFFRVSLFAHMLSFHSHDGWANHAVDLLATELLEFKAFELFALTFGIGVAVQTERAATRGIHVELFLLRRFLVLLVFGICHLVLISNVDILTLYAVCGLLLIPFLRLPIVVLAVAGLVAVYVPAVFPRGHWFPSVTVLEAHAANATRVYAQGGFLEILAFRWRETQDLIVPLLVASAQRTFGLMLLGVAVWRAGIIKQPQRYRPLLWVFFGLAGGIGMVNTTMEVSFKAFGWTIGTPLQLLGSDIPLAFSYAAGLLAWNRSDRADALLAPVAAAGRMALTNYLAQSIVLSLVFYGYGLGLFGRLGAAMTAAGGVLFYAGQLAISVWWLKRYRFGPFEWVWRSLTYGRRQRMRLRPSTAVV